MAEFCRIKVQLVLFYFLTCLATISIAHLNQHGPPDDHFLQYHYFPFVTTINYIEFNIILQMFSLLMSNLFSDPLT